MPINSRVCKHCEEEFDYEYWKELGQDSYSNYIIVTTDHNCAGHSTSSIEMEIEDEINDARNNREI